MNNTTQTKIDSIFTKVVTGSYIMTGTFSLIGNGIVIAVMLKKYKKASIFKWLLAHLAFCDIFFALALLFDVPFWIKEEWVYTEVMCKILPPSLFTASIAAEGTVVVIAIERYKGITKPLKVQWTKKHMCFALFVVWLFAGISVLPYVMILQTVTEGDKVFCVEKWNENPFESKNSAFIYSTYTFVGSFVIPMLVLAILYGRIIFIIRKPVNPIPYFEQIFRKRREKDIRITKLLIAVIVAFAFCVLPNHLGHFITATASLSKTEHEIMQYIMIIPYPFQSMINPIIYSIVDKQFRKDAINVFRCISRKRSLTRSTTTFIVMDSMKKYSVATNGRSSLGSNNPCREEDEKSSML